MTLASLLLAVIGVLGAFDIAWFHSWKGRLASRPECHTEALIHIARGVVYAAQFLVIPNLRLTGAWAWTLVGLFVVDAAVALADVLEEPASRAKQGGLSGGEYLMHIALSLLVGALWCAVFREAAAWSALPPGAQVSDAVPFALRALMLLMAVGSAGVALLEVLIVVESRLGPPAPVHVRVRLPVTPERAWNVTQDHRLHPGWDHRFDRITMVHEDGAPWTGPLATPDPRIATGTLMRYETQVGLATIHGFGRYRLHRPVRQSTFEFWSDDPRSLIAKGVGLWLYSPRPDGTTELSTSYTYAVRWGAVGKVVDRWLFRPFFQRFTEASFARLARRHFGVKRPLVLGREGRKPRRFDEATAQGHGSRGSITVQSERSRGPDRTSTSCGNAPALDSARADRVRLDSRDDLFHTAPAR